MRSSASSAADAGELRPPNAAAFAPCAIIPVYNHERAVGRVLAGVRAAELPCFLVDDGSSPRCAAELERLARAVPGTELLRLARNGGKGGAVIVGFTKAAERGFTHALQIDADGQHCLTDIPRFVAAARAAPAALVCGRPLFDASMPAVRRYGRYLTHGLVWLQTLSFAIPDSLCGFRVYPLGAVMQLLASEHVGARMEFDVEIIVRLYRRGVPLEWLDTRVTYPLDGVSHFRLLRDNARMVALQLRLGAGLVRRLPALLRRKWT
ncbi:MAG TPA: glycosyltransferase family 2 protein [Steroidobacteraceae bacterium]|nr:glycosyltransferase family 2 protein [Steroidobacteraceae bacterium]